MWQDCENVLNCAINNYVIVAVLSAYIFIFKDINFFWVVMNYDLCLAVLESIGCQ